MRSLVCGPSRLFEKSPLSRTPSAKTIEYMGWLLWPQQVGITNYSGSQKYSRLVCGWHCWLVQRCFFIRKQLSRTNTEEFLCNIFFPPAK